jgi:hypothetical protein
MFNSTSNDENKTTWNLTKDNVQEYVHYKLFKERLPGDKNTINDCSSLVEEFKRFCDDPDEPVTIEVANGVGID